MEVLLWMLGLAWRALVLIGGWLIIRAVIKDGTGTMREILETTGLAIKTGCIKLNRWLIKELSKEETKSAEESTNGTVD